MYHPRWHQIHNDATKHTDASVPLVTSVPPGKDFITKNVQ